MYSSYRFESEEKLVPTVACMTAQWIRRCVPDLSWTSSGLFTVVTDGRGSQTDNEY